MKEFVLAAGMISAALGLAGSFALMQDKPVPWAMQSYKGNTEAERAHKQTAQWYRRCGALLLALAFVAAAASSITGYLAGG